MRKTYINISQSTRRNLKNDTREWFEYCPEILDFFKTHSTIESIREVIKSYFGERKKIYKEKISKSLPVVWPYIISIKEIIGKLNYSMLEDYTLDCPDNFCEEWIKAYYPKDSDKILDYYRFVQSKITLEMAEFIDKLRKTDKGYFNNRLKELCESKFTEEEKSIIAQQVSEKFDRYYNILGPDRCRACGYRSTDLEREIKALNSKDNIMKEFYSRIEIGKRYTNAETKSIVGKIYIDLGLLYKTPKATDIFEYFDVKRVSMFDENRKKINGIEILGVKTI